MQDPSNLGVSNHRGLFLRVVLLLCNDNYADELYCCDVMIIMLEKIWNGSVVVLLADSLKVGAKASKSMRSGKEARFRDATLLEYKNLLYFSQVR